MFNRKQQPPAPLFELQALSYDQLLVRRNEIEAELAARGTTELDALKAKLAAVAEAQGLTIAELFKLKQKRKTRKQVGPKYQNPDNPSETWSGRGKPPQWLLDRIEAGSQKEDFALN